MSKPSSRTVALPDLAATEALAARLAALARPGDSILLEGDLGAGKTAFARAFLRAASGDPALEVPSPTFTLVQTYETKIGPVFHYDLWRLDGSDSLAELDWDDARDGIVLVEWPDRLSTLRPENALTIAFRLGEGEAREATLAGWDGHLPGVSGPIVSSVPPGAATRPVPPGAATRPVSWPGLARPSTTGGADRGKDVDGRHKAGHDTGDAGDAAKAGPDDEDAGDEGRTET
jgi:tRNA threonylcarbamoyladenosine biosynthesis protein TsaE